MSHFTLWSRLPEEIALIILDFVCKDIVYKMTQLNGGDEDVDFGKGLQAFAELFTVARQFYGLLHNRVQVDGLPVRPYLMRLQGFVFCSLLNSAKVLFVN